MKLGDRIKLHIERQPTFEDGEVIVTNGEFIVSEISASLPHSFNTDLWSHGYSHFSYAKEKTGDMIDIYLEGSVYVPTPQMLDEDVMENLHHDRKVVSWEIIHDNPKYTIPGFENLEDSLDKLTIRKSAKLN